jgi:hypothetical protein
LAGLPRRSAVQPWSLDLNKTGSGIPGVVQANKMPVYSNKVVVTVGTVWLALLTFVYLHNAKVLDRIDVHLERLTACPAEKKVPPPNSAQDARFPPSVNAAGDEARVANQELQILTNIEAKLAELRTAIDSIPMRSAFSSARSNPNPPDILMAPSLDLREAQKETAVSIKDAPPVVSEIPQEYRKEASEILEEYADLARDAIEAEYASGSLDQSSMERIKRETQSQVFGELSERIPPQFLENFIPKVQYAEDPTYI